MKNHDAGSRDYHHEARQAALDEQLAASALVCDCCGGELPESPAVIGYDVLCDACLLALTDPGVVRGLLAVARYTEAVSSTHTIVRGA